MPASPMLARVKAELPLALKELEVCVDADFDSCAEGRWHCRGGVGCEGNLESGALA